MKKSKGQFLAITALVIVGLMFYTALSAAAINMGRTLKDYYHVTNFADIYVKVVKIPQKDVKNLENINGIKRVAGRVVFDVPLKVENEKEKVNVRVISIPDKDETINSLFMKEGAYISSEIKDVMVLEQFAKARKIKLNQILKLQIDGKEYNLKVKGIVASPEYIYLMEDEQSLLPEPGKFGVLFVSNKFAQQSFGFEDSYNEIVIQAKSEYDVEKIKKKLEKILKRYGVKRIITKEEQLSNRMISEEISQLKKSSNTIPLVFLGVAAIIIGVMVSKTVKNDRMAIGVLKALGFNNVQIIFHYTKYALMIGIIGAIIGTVFGMVLSGYMTKLYIQFYNIPMLKINFYYRYMFLAVFISSVFCIISGLLGARKVLNILPAESMRPEAPKVGKSIWLEKIIILWERISFSWKIVLRDIFRNKKRFVFITFGIALTYAITLIPLHQNHLFIKIFHTHYGTFQRMDYNINFSRPMHMKVINDITHIVETDKIEPKIEYPFEIVYGWKSKVVTVIGLKKNTEFYYFVNLKNKKIDIPKKGIVLSENLARYLGVKKGEQVKIKTFIPDREDIYVEVKEIIKQSLGINAYMNIQQMNTKLLDKKLITGVYLDTNDNVKEKLENAKNITSIKSLEDSRNVFKQFLKLTIFSIGIMILFAGILGFAIVYNATVMSISERRLEFSSLRVLGFTKKEIYRIISKENGIMTILGIIMGIPIGKYMVYSIMQAFNTELYTLDTDVALSTYVFAGIFTIVFVSLSQLFTLRKINGLDFMEALKNRIS
ncbi:ABC transporter permease [Crassaminicella thermophila]|nr:ABC transporter permease [Crassaminicella thermophila]